MAAQSTTFDNYSDRTAARPLMAHPRVLGVCFPDDGESLKLCMLLQLLRIDGFTTRFAGAESANEIRNLIEARRPDLICLSCPTDEHVAMATDLVREIREQFRDVAVIAAGVGAKPAQSQLLEAGCLPACQDFHEAGRAVWRFATKTKATTQVKPASGRKE